MAIIIMYLGEYEDVFYCFAHVDDQYGTISGRLQDFIVRGNVTEILEYVPNVCGDEVAYCDRWREHLRQLGYNIRRDEYDD